MGRNTTIPKQLAAHLVRDIDTLRFPSLERALAAVPTSELRDHAELAFALGRLRAMRDDLDGALDWMSQAFSLASHENAPLAARIGFELGAIHIRRGEVLAADMVLAATEGMAGANAADVLHLRALLTEIRGELALARDLYRRAVAAGHEALSSVTSVLALRNLAGLLLHVSPKEGLALTGMALRAIEARQLDPRLRPSILNTRSYALACLGELDEAAEIAAVAQAAAGRLAQPRIELYAMFNGAIASELRGDLAASAVALAEVTRKAEVIGAGDILTWARLRSLWLNLLTDGPGALGRVLDRSFPEPVAEPYKRTVATLRALITLADAPNAAATKAVSGLVQSYTLDGDDLTAFALLFWLCHAHVLSGRHAAARHALRRAHEIGVRRGFRISPNWWSHTIVVGARSLADDDQIKNYLVALRSAPCGRVATRSTKDKSVVVGPHAQLLVEGVTLPASCWREGRSGPKMLQRYFYALAEAHPNALMRDDLTDLLWPESDGASAIQNLYAATHDLRRVVSAVPGLQLVVDDRMYRLRGEANVSFEMSRRAERATA